jgi:CBS domain containing-hemolysin-like protein
VTPALGVVLAAVLVTVLAALMTRIARDVDAVRALALTDEEVRGAAALLWLVERPVLVHRVSAAVSVLAALAIALAVPTPAGVVGAAAAVLLLAPLAARLVAGRRIERVGLRLAPALRAVVRVVTGPLEAIAPGGRRDDEDEDGDEDEDEEPGAGEETVLDPDERRMIRSILELDDTAAREIMVPRPDMITVGADATFTEVVDLALARGRSRLPVHDPADPDRIVGVVHARDLFKRLREGEAGWDDLVRAPHLVPESMRADDLLRELQAAAVHLALVVDEYGGVSGLVTIEDVLEEIVGEIVDEHDDEAPAVVALGAGRWRAAGRVNVHDLGAELGVELPDEEWDSVGGLVLGLLGRIPRVGDAVEVAGLRIAVSARRGRRIVEVVVTRVAPASGPEGADGPGDGGPQAPIAQGARP